MINWDDNIQKVGNTIFEESCKGAFDMYQFFFYYIVSLKMTITPIVKNKNKTLSFL